MKRTYQAAFLVLWAILVGGFIRASAQAPAPAAPPAAALTPVATAEPVTRRVDYNWDVRPILSDYCFRCHGPDEKSRQAGLRLDIPEGAYAALRRPGTFAIVPGKPADSQMIFRITHANAAVRMPPQVANKVLSPQQIEILRAWIAQGAEYKPHWAFTAPQKAAIPAIPAGPSVLTDIDRFVQARLEREGLRLSAPADKETLINRVTLTLTGLPPTLAEVDAFLKDTSPQAYEKLVDRLLASTAYGEHIGEQWLDIARYAESDGFLDDTHDRLLWPYRDWVIAALNRNMPFDQFATWQLAGDLLPSHTKEQLLATAFMRVGKRTTENGAIDEEYRVEYAVDRAITVGTGFLAMTVGCARCHDHKYDPIPTKDFYALTGFFNSVDEPGFYAPGRSGITPGPAMLWADEATEKQLAGLQAAVAKAEAAYAAARAEAAKRVTAKADALLADPAKAAEFVRQSADIGLQAYYPFETLAPIPDDRLPQPLPQKRLSPPPMAPETLKQRCGGLVSDVGCLDGTFEPAVDDETVAPAAAPVAAATPVPAPAIRLAGGLQREDLMFSPSAGGGAPPAYVMLPKLDPGIKGKGFHFDDNERGFFGKGVGYFERTQPFSLDLWVKAGMAYEESTILNHRETENAGNAGYQLQFDKGHLRWEMMHSRAGNGISLLATQAFPLNEWKHVTVTYDGSSKASGTRIYVDGAAVDVEVTRDNLTRTIIPNGNANINDDAFGLAFGKRIRAQTLKGGAIDEVRVYTRALAPIEVRQLQVMTQPAAAAPQPSRSDLVDLLIAQDSKIADAFATLTAARNIENETISLVPQVAVMGDLPTPRPTYVLVRGNYEDHGEQIPPRGLNQVLPWNPAWPENRLGLAQWLFDPRNPLTARVYVNRAWQAHFGRGLVETAEDFGSQGSLPTNPELLDYLAVTFRESGWDIKKLHKLIVMSGTYRQQSAATEELLQKDPNNLLLARFTRIRMPAEMVRDQALAASGLLVKRVGGPSVYPYQPPNMWDGFNVYKYPEPDEVPSDEHHRRSMYSFIKRNAPHPNMATFDLPDRGGATARRRTSNSPLQALVLLDDPQFLEAYRALATQALKADAAPDARIEKIFRLATRRHTRPDEMATLRLYYDAQVQRFTREPQAADALLRVGVTPVPAGVDAVQLAALMNVTTAVMNTPDAYMLR
jgi:hypothetical protein